MILGPCFRIFRVKSTERHPLASSQQSIDFWGPCAVVSVYVALLWLGTVRDGPWAYIIWTIPAVFNHFIMRSFTKSTLLQHMSIIGYSIAPILPLAGIIILFHPPVWIATSIEIIAISWASAAAILSYISTMVVPPEHKHRLSLLFPSIILTEMYFISLLPIRFYFYHKKYVDPTTFPTSQPTSPNLSNHHHI